MYSTKLLLLAGISLATLCQPVNAQEAQSNDAETQSAEPQNDIVVTGSRITSNGDNLPTPVTVASTEQLLKTSPSNIPDGLNKLPIFALSRGTANLNNPSDNFTGNYLNLRGFGIQRNLILLDGNRMAPTSYTGAVDTNVIPQMLVQRVEVVTGGASAVYGSDAVSGVINFILNKEFEGIKVEAQSGVSSRGDAASWRAGAAFGANFGGGRGHFMASYEHFQQDGLDDKEARRNGRAIFAVAGSGSAADPFRLITNARNSAIPFQGGNLFTGRLFSAPGVLGNPARGVSQGGALASGGDGFYGIGSSATADLRTDQAFARADYELSDNVSIYVQGFYAKARTENTFYPNLIFPTLVASDNAFLSPAAQAELLAGGPVFLYSRVFDDPAHELGVRAQSENWMGSAGLTGDFGDFNWNVHYQHSVSETKNTQVNNVLLGNLYASLDAVDQGRFAGGPANGNIVCRVTLTNPTAYPGCVPLNGFGATPASQAAALDYITGDNFNTPEFTMDVVSASISGTAFDNWAGPVRFAVSGEYRNVQLDVSTNAPSNVFANCTGLRFNCVPGTPVYRDTLITPISVTENVKEAALEVDFPLLRDSGVGSLSLSGAARYTDYSTSGSVTTWKVGGDWQIADGLRFRATRSRDIRAPSLYELFQPQTGGASGYFDLLTNSSGPSGIVTTSQGGNSALVPEKADTLTFGGVFRPSGIPGLSIAVDYYKIKLNNAISQIDGRLASIQSACNSSGGTSAFCSLYDRPLPFSNTTPANFPSLVRLTTLNASSIKTWGIDGEINYNFSVGSEGRISLRGLVGYQPQLTTILAPGIEPQLGAGAAASQSTGGVPKLRLTGFVSYSNSDFSIDLQQRWRSSLKWDATRSLVFNIPDVPSVAYTDITFTFFPGKDKDKQIFFSVQNLLDKNPPPYLTAGTSGTPAFSFPAVSGDDIIGRYLTVGAKFKF
ncbi:tonB dependent receptor family protein (plasmid) [Blastomonas sp. RAC04]|uniref:TonB-dependent receptor plug domain-containing protein n=1 Tax=Blastomonas sp. RAC04 TaxID=1842535 RepID=UPI00083D4C65|nr:TonB-dependent receptor [Blastomonas sp. RAC04]AOF98765.1 tonB dependent receptor family protein [Blastomonas sp. RAC04]